jgi:hypothetical protein
MVCKWISLVALRRCFNVLSDKGVQAITIRDLYSTIPSAEAITESVNDILGVLPPTDLQSYK